MFEKLNELQQLCYDTHFGKVSNYTKEEGNVAIQKIFEDALPPMPTRRADFERYCRKNAQTLYALIEETVSPILNRLSIDRFGDRIQVDTYDLGDKPIYRVKNKNLYPVCQIAKDTGATHRRRMHDSKIETEEFDLSAFVYEEGFDILTGKVTWSEIADKVVESFVHKTATLITGTIFDAYDDTINPFHVESNKDGLEVALRELIEKVTGATGVDCEILGTKGALAKIPFSGGVYSQKDADDKREFGFVRMFEETDCVLLPQYYDKETEDFEIPRDILLIVPKDGTKLAYCGYEGDVVVANKDNPYDRKDRQVQMEMLRSCSIGVPIALNSGMLKILAN